MSVDLNFIQTREYFPKNVLKENLLISKFLLSPEL